MTHHLTSRACTHSSHGPVQVRLVNEQVRLDGGEGRKGGRPADAVATPSSSNYSNSSSQFVTGVLTADSVAESLFKKVRLHRLDFDVIVAKTRMLLAKAEAES